MFSADRSMPVGLNIFVIRNTEKTVGEVLASLARLGYVT
jgi:hypothetical protein